MNSLKELFDCYMDYPKEVVIETTGVCNAKCVFCPHEQLSRKNESMSDELFLKIIEQLEEIPKEHHFFISPFKVNEILMDPKFFERIDIINERLPNALIRIFSNFNAATEESIKKICNIKNIFDIDISLNSLYPEEYKKLMGLDLNKTVENISFLLEYIVANGIRMRRPKITFSRVSITPETDKRYLDTFNFVFKEYLDLVEPFILTRGEWIDHMPNKTPARQAFQCGRWAECNICCNGVVAFCCMDAKGDYSLGNVNDNTILEIYNHPEYRRLRTGNILKRDVIPCRYCSL